MRLFFSRIVSIKLVCAVVLFSSVFMSVGPAEANRFNEKELKILQSGGVVRRIFSDSGEDRTYGGSSWAIVEAAPKEVWAAIQDWSSYTEVYPHTVETKELSRRPGRFLIRMRLGHPIIQVVYHIEMRPDWTKKTMTFGLVESYPHDVDAIKGYWQIFPLSDGKTLVAYVFRVQVPTGILQMLSDSFKKMALSGVLGAPGHLKKWIEVRAAGRYSSPGTASHKKLSEKAKSGSNKKKP